MQKISFVALDVETATAKRSSICEIGISVVKDGGIVETKSWLVRPEGNKYDRMNIAVHGIRPEDTAGAPSFAEVWKEVLPYVQGGVVVAHNTSFDMYALRDAMLDAGVEFPDFEYYCSLRVARYAFKDTYSYSLPILCKAMGIEFGRHHRAGGDAEGCAKVFMKSLELAGVNTLDELQSKYGFRSGEFAAGKHVAQRSIISSSKGVKAGEIKGDPDKIDPDNYFYGKHVCFTGKCLYGVRAEMLKIIADIGGVPVDSVTGTTDVLVVGQQDYRVVGDEGLSGKQKKAMNMKDKGQDIEILSEMDFMTMI